MCVLKLDENNRILSSCKKLPNKDYNNRPQVETLPEGDITDYLYINNEYIYDPLPKPPEPEPAPEYVTYDELAKAIREGVNSYGI